MRRMTRTARLFSERWMNHGRAGIGDHRLVAGPAKIVLTGKQHRFCRRAVRIMTLRALAALNRLVNADIADPLIDISMTVAAKFSLTP